MNAIEWAAAAFGVAGTLLLATRGRFAGWGFVAYLASNAGWIVFAWRGGHWALLAQQLAFTVSSLIGAWVWLLQPRLANLFDYGVKTR
jgi:nicotinamide riboside transporter PnuC